MYKAQLSDGEQIACEEYEHTENGIELYAESDDFLAFVPYTHVLWVGEVRDDGQTKW